MKKLNLKYRLLSMIVPSLVVLVALGGFIIWAGIKEENSALLLKEKANGLIKLSEVIHQLQIERGMSNLYISKKLTKEEFSEQEGKVNKLRESFKAMDVSKSEAIKNSSDKINEIIEAARSAVMLENPKESIPKYSEAIKLLIKLQVTTLDGVAFEGIEGNLKSLTIFENAKENMGKLRGNLNGVFAQNMKKELHERDLFSSFISGITINLESPGLIVSTESKTKAEEILVSQGWKDVLSDFKIFTEKYQTGDYGVDAKKFFKNITDQINAVNDVLKEEQGKQISMLDKSVAEKKSLILFMEIAICSIVLTVIAYSLYSIKNLNLQFFSIVSLLEKSSHEINSTSKNVANGSEELSQATIEQASSLQETSSSIEEISSMVDNTRDFAVQSGKVADVAVTTSEDGQGVVKEMISSIGEIDKNNKNVALQMADMNQEVKKILDIINEIATKTKVINDIVFQTKLLSFNASEISSILSLSTKTVDDIVKNYQVKIDHIIGQSNQTIGNGIKVASDCERAFNDLNERILEISKMANEISSASNEQTKGVMEITKAIAQLDQVAQLNSANASRSSNVATSLAQQANSLDEIVQTLVGIVSGSNEKKAS